MPKVLFSAPTAISYSPLLEAEITRLAGMMTGLAGVNGRYPSRWLAIQLLEGDETLLAELGEDEKGVLVTAVADSHQRLQPHYGDGVDLAITDERYQFVHQLVGQVLTAPQATWSFSDRIDRIITNRWLGIPIFLALMYVVFSLVQNVSAPFLDWVDSVIGSPITNWAVALLTWLHAPVWLISLLTDGVIAGVGGVLTFLPGLLVMYLALAILEDTGYLARAAFVMDRSMSKLGLHGRSFVPMILGFGCNVPAIYATRTIESKSARILTGLLIPFMSCSARLPVYVIFGLAFFPRNGNLVIWALYLIGIVVAAVIGLVLSRTIFKGEAAGILMMEMPAYRWPAAKRVLAYTWEESASFVRKAGSFILIGTVIFWLLLNFPWGVDNPQESLFGQVSGAIAPTLAPAGFGDWQASGALLTGLLAKEMVVSTLAQVYVGEANDGGETAVPIHPLTDLRNIVVGFGAATLDAGKQLLETLTPGIMLFPNTADDGNTALTHALRQSFTPLSAFAFLIFVLLYVPCIATVGAQIAEFGWRWAALSVVITLLVPWVLATAVYQVGGLVSGM
ncbi:MAG: ferrous iron transport protein B [Ardenticatenaceae bacterium]|nr:ferrous iron transport protein B [Anaerolineales bacterium]MCB8921089.1 ferrous iron transport protein B [Ardenticatenaceae bacterium]MCB9005356.1 ferrous iron transport protein B [Ardenticatenaceae bacterium]